MLRIKTLSKEHNRSDFDCGVPELNQYLKNIARQHLNKGISRTFVLVDDAVPTEITGFFTLAFCEVFVEKLPREYVKKYPHKAPAAKLARLAVAKERQRQGLGMHMLVNAIERIINVSSNVGIIGFFVDAKNNDAKAYYEQFGFIPLPDRPLELFLPLATLRKAYDTVLGHV
ncbi:MAG: GNAT family N-acetyltransferase [Nitrospirota bacterium]|nr:GNAT family N-acetyltransferase [Nitrospirota bacterium]